MYLDYSLKTADERIACVNNIIENTPKERLTPNYLTAMSDYILFVTDRGTTKKERKEEYPISTKNREVTINKRQGSFEGLVSNFKNGEDGIYSMIRNDKNQILDPKHQITKEDAEDILEIKEGLDLIDKLKKKFDTATGMARYHLKRQIIETYQQIYIIKSAYQSSRREARNLSQIKTIAQANLDEKIWLDNEQMPHSNGLINLFNPTHVSFLLHNYSYLKQETYDDLNSDMRYLLLDLEHLADETLTEYPILYDLLILKVDGKANEEIEHEMEAKYGIVHNAQYWSTLWRKRIPKLISRAAIKQYLIWHFTNVEYGQWKKCGKCGQTKLAHPFFFSRNTSKDSFYSICKECRRKKQG